MEEEEECEGLCLESQEGENGVGQLAQGGQKGQGEEKIGFIC